MDTKIIMTSSTLFYAIIGVLICFLPNEIAGYLEVESTIITIIFLNILSALFLGFGILNWMAKGTLIGGIYNKPILIGNLMHFGVGAIGFLKVVFDIRTHLEIVISLTVVYWIFTILFVYIFRTTPIKTERK